MPVPTGQIAQRAMRFGACPQCTANAEHQNRTSDPRQKIRAPVTAKVGIGVTQAPDHRAAP